MERQNKGLMIIVAVLAVSVLAMSVGFAAYSTTLNIKGTANVNAAKWDVSFDGTTTGTVVDSASKAYANSAPTATDKADGTGVTGITTEATTVSFLANLKAPGDVATVTATVKNNGTFKAQLTGITMPDITAYSKYLTYTVNVGGTDYTASSSSLSGVTLAPNATATVTMTIKYILPTNATDLPSADKLALPLTTTLTFTQVD